jgi:hypothetical protein
MNGSVIIPSETELKEEIEDVGQKMNYDAKSCYVRILSNVADVVS